ncbi:FHA domain-containing protein [uncultured Muribaculum sp.]|uniref:FHA domain-containing protein n=1 Tax=uncultured Muribaculum sp. TaxID=1918613 RepID=UPI002711F6D3|nr:FHA domain-containing protein [uncultured Muribaculum sp.]
MNCPYCNSQIDNRSLYCDQCGTKITPPKAHNPVNSNNIGEDVYYLEDIEILSDNPYISPLPPTPSRLVCQKYGMEIKLSDGAIIGRTQGAYTSILGKCKYLSSKHASLKRTSDGWTITDLDSTNGTTVNGRTCHPTLPFYIGDKVCLAVYYEFIVL